MAGPAFAKSPGDPDRHGASSSGLSRKGASDRGAASSSGLSYSKPGSFRNKPATAPSSCPHCGSVRN